jgi:hypothetical protein
MPRLIGISNSKTAVLLTLTERTIWVWQASGRGLPQSGPVGKDAEIHSVIHILGGHIVEDEGFLADHVLRLWDAAIPSKKYGLSVRVWDESRLDYLQGRNWRRDRSYLYTASIPTTCQIRRAARKAAGLCRMVHCERPLTHYEHYCDYHEDIHSTAVAKRRGSIRRSVRRSDKNSRIHLTGGPCICACTPDQKAQLHLFGEPKQ